MDRGSELSGFIPEHDFFAGIDSDGCVFDSMEVKQKEFFIPSALKYFNLFPVSKYVRETWEFVNLYSFYRGLNRFHAIVKVFGYLSERHEIIESGCLLPDTRDLKKWIASETRLSNATLRAHHEKTGDPSTAVILEWSEHVNTEINRWLKSVPPFGFAREAIERISSFADTAVISQTPLEALVREWEENGIRRFATLIAGQEHGTKTEHLALAAKNKYHSAKILMIGDAYGDLQAAKDNGVLFYPVIPGREVLSWKRLLGDALGRFTDGTYSGSYENSLIAEFKNSLPSELPWL